MQGKICAKCGEWKVLEEYHKNKEGKYGRNSQCKECKKEYNKQHYQNNKEHIKEQHKQWRENNIEHEKEQKKQWYQNNKEHEREQNKQYYQNNKEHHKEHVRLYKKNKKQNNLQYISSIVEQINPVFKQLNLPVYGYVYMFENIKTKHKYLGQSINPIKTRYGHEGGIIKSWIKERLDRNNQKFTEELIEKDIVVTEVLDVAFCQYHLDKLEAYYINKYDSYNNGYNNTPGNHNTSDGIEEFYKILEDHNLLFVDGELIENCSQLECM